MTRRAPLVRAINMLPERVTGETQGFFRALSEADGFVYDAEHGAEALVRVDELTQLIADIKEIHNQVLESWVNKTWRCDECKTEWPCRTMALIENNQPSKGAGL